MPHSDVQPLIISRTDDLAAFCDRLAGTPFITVDTEFIRESTFWAQLCLVQVAGPDEAAIVDPLAPGIDLGPFYDLLADQRTIKVFHAARQDIEIFVRQTGAVPHPIFDTQVAAMVCGYGDQVSYDQLVQRITGGHIDKTSRFTDWAQRPLSPKQITYAIGDVTYLRDVYLKLRSQLEAEGRLEWVAEEMAILTDVQTYRTDPEHAWQRLKLRVRKPRQLLLLQRLSAWREREAQERDLPRGRVLKDDVIYEIAMQQPTDAEQLGALRSLPRGFERSSTGRALLAVVADAMAVPESELPRLPKMRQGPEYAGAASELLRVLLKMAAEQHGVAPRIIASSDDLDRIASEDAPDVPAMRGWRRQLFGEQALALKRGELALSLNRRGVAAVPLQREPVQAAEAAE